MSNSVKHTFCAEAVFFLDISAEVCPMTMVRTKLLIERMAPGDIAEIRLPGGEPMESIPRTLQRQGHRIIDSLQEPDANPAIYRVVVQKRAG